MNKGCLLKTLMFLILLPIVLAMPPVAFAFFAFCAWTGYFLSRRD
ncbi:MAG: hypothetical protein ACLP9L_15460 [Thermoguttaceae bacterium]